MKQQEGHILKSKTINELLKADNRPTKDKQVVFDFATFSRKTPKRVLVVFNDSSKKKFGDYCVEQFLKYTAQLHNMLPSNRVREHVNIICSFFKYN